MAGETMRQANVLTTLIEKSADRPGTALPVGEAASEVAAPDCLRLLVCGAAGRDWPGLIARLQRAARAPEQHPGLPESGGESAGGGLGNPDDSCPAAALPPAGMAVGSLPMRPGLLVLEAFVIENHLFDMLAGAPAADLVVLVAAASSGLSARLRRDACLASLSGIRHIVLVIDTALPDFDVEALRGMADDFEALAAALHFASYASFAVPDLNQGTLDVRLSHMSLERGLSDHLQAIARTRRAGRRFVFSVQHVERTASGARCLRGSVTGGRIARGDGIRMNASGQLAPLGRLLSPTGIELAEAAWGQAVTLVPDGDVEVFAGELVSRADEPLDASDQFSASIIWLHEDAGVPGRSYEFKLANQVAGASITSLEYRIDVDTLTHEPCRQLAHEDIAVGNLALDRPVLFDTPENSPALGGFVLQDRISRCVVAVGFIRHSLRRARNVHRQALSISRERREEIKSQRGRVVWFTGLSGSGKSTLANALERELHARGRHTYLLDGDNIRQGLNRDLGFSAADRVENIRRVAEVSRLMLDAGLIVMTAFISPFRAEREMARELIGQENFLEVYLDTPLEICEQRDAKGLYKKARSGLLPNMTGIDSPYEVPERPGLVIDGRDISVDDAVACLIRLLGDS